MVIKYERGTLKDELKSACLSVHRSAFRVHHSNSGGDDRIRTCDRLLTYNGLANRRLQPLGHISAKAKPILARKTLLSSRRSGIHEREKLPRTRHPAMIKSA